MDKKEFEEIVTPRVNNGIGGGVSPEMWRVIEDVYMTTNLTKDQVADIFWNHTGQWSQIEAAVKKHIAAERSFNDAVRRLCDAQVAYKQSLRDMDSVVNFCKDLNNDNI